MIKVLTPSGQKIDVAERQRRQAEALRDNLARRKNQNRARQSADQPPASPCPASPSPAPTADEQA